jgi:group I intron endonuclease
MSNKVIKGVYSLTFPNGKKYIGYSCEKKGVTRRWDNHKTDSFNINSDQYNSKKSRAIRKYGWENVIRRVLIISDNEEYCKNMEIALIDCLNTKRNGYNSTEGGDGCSGMKLSKLTRKRMRISKTGVKFTEEHKKNLSKALSGLEKSEKEKERLRKLVSNMSIESRRKIGEASRNRIVTEETRNKISALHTGRKRSEETREKMRQSWIKRRNQTS